VRTPPTPAPQVPHGHVPLAQEEAVEGVVRKAVPQDRARDRVAVGRAACPGALREGIGEQGVQLGKERWRDLCEERGQGGLAEGAERAERGEPRGGDERGPVFFPQLAVRE